MPSLLSKKYKKSVDSLPLPIFEKLRGSTRIFILLKELGISRAGAEKIQQDPDPIKQFDWDNLIIIDACRYDIWQEVVGRGDSRITVGSGTPEFLKENFSDGDWNDTIYISANPNVSERVFNEKTGRRLEEVFHSVYKTYKSNWNSEEKTVLPNPVFRDAVSAQKLFPSKKKIIHLMQPHHPFVNEEFDEPGFADSFEENKNFDTIWDMAEKREVSHGEVVKAYKENLEFVMSKIEKYSDQLNGKTLLTSDHGNLLGEGGYYGHETNSDFHCLRKVPICRIE